MSARPRRRFLWILAAVNIVAIPVFFYAASQRHSRAAAPQAAPLPVYGTVAPFSLSERSGSVLSSEGLSGKPWIASFIFTNCPNQCPMMSHKMSLLQQTLPPDVKLVSISVDPERDTPEALAKYAKSFHADEARWLFLTGAKEEVKGVLRSFHMDNSDDPDLHSLRFALVDPSGAIRGYYDSTDVEALKKLPRDVEALRREARDV
jgi:cytochrome oxidase Cu insertion factor (SCO1/SenC/PrrC family)